MNEPTNTQEKAEDGAAVALQPVVRRRRKIRARLVPVTGLDAALLELQDAGNEVCNLIPYHGSVKGQTEDVGHGKGEIGIAMEMSFVVTYLERVS